MAVDILTAEEFAYRLKIGRSTLFDWLSKGVLVPGKHYVRIGRVLRFMWTDDIVASLAEATMQPKPVVKQSRPTLTRPGIDWDY